MLEVESRGRTRILTLDRPEKLNAFDAALYAACSEALERAADDDGVHAVVLTGRGRAFCAGADLAELAASAAGRSNPAFAAAAERFVGRLNTYPKPLLAAVNGLAVGIGTTLLTYADLVLAASSARFRTPFASLGVAPEVGSSWRLPRVVGWQNAAWMLLSSAWVDAEEAERMGLVWRCVPDGALRQETLAAATAIAEHPLASLMAIKQTLQAWRSQPTREAEERENRAFAALMAQGGYRPPR